MRQNIFTLQFGRRGGGRRFSPQSTSLYRASDKFILNKMFRDDSLQTVVQATDVIVI